MCVAQVATDIASRGLDIPDVQMIIQDGLPSHAESYVHRTGRTGRAGKKGKAVLLYRERDRQEVGGLLRDLRVPLQFHAPPVMKVSVLAVHSHRRDALPSRPYQIPSLIPVERCTWRGGESVPRD